MYRFGGKIIVWFSYYILQGLILSVYILLDWLNVLPKGIYAKVNANNKARI